MCTSGNLIFFPVVENTRGKVKINWILLITFFLQEKKNKRFLFLFLSIASKSKLSGWPCLFFTFCKHEQLQDIKMYIICNVCQIININTAAQKIQISLPEIVQVI